MKKIHSFFTASAMVAMSVCGLTSCSNDNEFNEIANNALKASSDVVKQDEADAKNMTPEQIEEAKAEFEKFANINITDSIDFNHDQFGATSVDNEIHNDYLNSMNTRGGGGIVFSILKWCAGKGVSYGGGTIGSMAMNVVFDYMGLKSNEAQALENINAQMDELNKTVNEISGKLDNVSTKLEEIMDKKDATEISEIFRNRWTDYYFLNKETSISYENMMKCLKVKDYDGASQVAAKWAESDVYNGNNGTKMLENYMVSLIEGGNNSLHYPMPKLYDFWIYQLTPWEHEGYAMREAIRNADIATVSMGMILSRAYYYTSGISNAERRLSNLYNLQEKLCKIYEANPVKHHDDKLICQIKGAHIVFNKNFAFPNIESRGHDVNKPLDLGRITLCDDENKENLLTSSEVQAIASYYKIKNLNELESKLGELGFDISGFTSSKPHTMVLSGGYESKSLEKDCRWASWSILDIYQKFDMTINQTLSTSHQDLTSRPYNLGTLDCVFSVYRLKGKWYANRWEDGHKCNDVQFYHPNIDSRYKGVYPKGF